LALLAEHAAEAKCFAWVAERLAALSLAVPVTVDNARTRIGAALAAYGALDFPLPLYSLAGAQRPSDVLGSALATMSAEDRTTTLDALPPLTALTYLATLAAYSRGHVFERSPAQLCALADGVGSHDVWRAASLLVIIAGRIALIDSDEVARDPKHVEMAWSLTQAAIARGASHDRYLRAAQKIAKLQPDPAATEMIDAQVRSLAATVMPDDFEHMRDLLLREMSFGLAEGAVLGFITLGETSGRVDAVADAVKQLLARGLSPLTAELRSALARLHIG
jgi:hypothetical protein